MDVRPWQFDPAIAAVTGSTRLLLADAVGLGKTVQAAIVLAELRARGFVRRALVLTPAALREQWAGELRDRFALDSHVFDHAALARLAADLPPGVNPWAVAAIAISSIDLVKRGEVRRALDAISLDLLIVDEAHHLRPGTDRGALVADLAARVPWLVLVTATPHSGEEHAYAFLRNLGRFPGTAEITAFRRGAEAADRPPRRVAFHSITTGTAERELLDETMAYGRAIWRAHKALVAAVICRRAVSSPAALSQTLRRRRALLAGEAPRAVQTQLPWQEIDERDGIESDRILGAAPLASADKEGEWLDRLMRLTAAVSDWSKARVLARLLSRTNEPAIVFSEYRDTLTFLYERLVCLTSVAVIHGGLSARERRENIRRFTSGAARVLLATDTAGEGLNLQQRCRLVVNVELPWNPLRLEQRIGRVDRIGQSRRVHAIQLVYRATFEDDVLARFEKRLHIAQRALEMQTFDEHAVAAAVFDRAGVAPLQSRQPRSFSSAALPRAAALRRRVAADLDVDDGQPRFTHAVCASFRSRLALTSRMATLFECDVHDSAGRLVAREVIPLVVEFTRSLRLRPREVRRIVIAVVSSEAVREHVTAALRRRELLVARETETTAAALIDRLERLLAALDGPHRDLMQPSLFDKRTEQQARASDAASAAIREHLERRLAAARALRHVRASTPRLVAVWPFRGR
jgi:superfamily II DNA or RNA helicase